MSITKRKESFLKTIEFNIQGGMTTNLEKLYYLYWVKVPIKVSNQSIWLEIICSHSHSRITLSHTSLKKTGEKNATQKLFKSLISLQ